jgi:hypothetical protein
MDEFGPVAMRIAMKFSKRKPDEDDCDLTISQTMIESWMCMVTATSFDIACAIGVLSRYNHNSSNEHMVALKWVFRYLITTNDWRLRLGGALGERVLGGDGDGALRCYVDLDYAGCPDEYKSTSQLLITFGGEVDW